MEVANIKIILLYVKQQKCCLQKQMCTNLGEVSFLILEIALEF